ncbi:MAG: signal peptidase II [Synergistaceae bacterium]|nr:signal peptidase II [Synergistaceae bacterium]
MKRVGVFVLAQAADRGTKLWALSSLAVGSGGEGAYFSLGLHFNRGMAFSLLSKFPGAAGGVALTGLFFLLLLCLKDARVRAAPGIPLLWAGALGNLLDRVFYGYVIDWIYVLYGYINLADVSLCLGTLLFFTSFLQCFRRMVEL